MSEVTIELGPQKSEFAVFINGKLVFSRLEQRHYPEADELIDIFSKIDCAGEKSDRIICYCLNVNENTIVEAINTGAKSLKDIQQSTKACTGNRCKELNPSGNCCSGDILAILQRETGITSESGCSCCQ